MRKIGNEGEENEASNENKIQENIQTKMKYFSRARPLTEKIRRH